MPPAKRLLLSCVLLAALPLAFAQGQAPATGGESAASAAQARDAAAAGASRDALAGADARHCLEFPTNPQVIACAEKYRPDRRRS